MPMFTLYLLAAWVGLFVVSFVLAGIAHNYSALAPVSVVVQMIHRVLGYLFIPAILIDVARWVL